MSFENEITIKQISPNLLHDYASIPIAFDVKSIFRLAAPSKGGDSIGFTLSEIAVNPWPKNYDELDNPENWAKRWDLSHWGFFQAYQGTRLIGGVAIAYDTPGVFMLENRKDMCVIWDIRVHPQFRHIGAGKRLFDAAEDFARGKSCTLVKIETQNINVPACKFYKKNGCHLGAINLLAYPELPNEIQLIWYKKLI